eukprot:8575192-Pyramimonas_sp.AAC.1
MLNPVNDRVYTLITGSMTATLATNKNAKKGPNGNGLGIAGDKIELKGLHVSQGALFWLATRLVERALPR